MTKQEGMLVLVRHGQSVDNERNLFSGWRDPALTELGRTEALASGRQLRGVDFDVAFTSTLSRARNTLDLMLREMEIPSLSIVVSEALKERDYGELSGLNKEEARLIWGSDQVRLWRKSYHAVPPGGESLEMTAARMLPFWKTEVDPRLAKGQRVLVVAHGNSLRSIVTHIENIPIGDVDALHIATSQIIAYRVDHNGYCRQAVGQNSA